MTTREPEWDEEQQGLILALLLVRGMTCDGCGGHLPDTTAEDADYVADLPYRCHKCTAIAQKADEYREAPHAQALRYPTRRKGGGS